METRTSSDVPPASEAAPARSEPVDPLIGRQLGEYIIIDKLNQGGQGAIYRAKQPALDRDVIIKVLLEKTRENSDSVQRFMREAKLASTLDHPFAAHVYGFGHENDGLLWIAMEHVRGTPMNQIIKRDHRIPIAQLVPLIERLCEVVHTAHEQGITHRDLKPSNIVIITRAGRFSPKLLDLGIGKLSTRSTAVGIAPSDLTSSVTPTPSMLEAQLGGLSLLTGSKAGPDTARMESSDRSALTPSSSSSSMKSGDMPTGNSGLEKSDSSPSSGSHGNSIISNSISSREMMEQALSSHLTLGKRSILGTPAYMPPEQWIDSSLTDARSDIYSLGIVCYEALTGKVPFFGKSVIEIARKHTRELLPALGEEFPQRVYAVLAKATAKAPADRYQDMLEFAAALREASELVPEGEEPLAQLDEVVRDSVLTEAPRPIAESVAAMDVARSPEAALLALRQCATGLARYLNVLALASRLRVEAQAGADDSALTTLLQEIRKGRVSGEVALSLAIELCRPFSRNVGTHPIPELVGFLVSPAGDATPDALRLKVLLEALGKSQDASGSLRTVYAHLLPDLSRAISSTAFLSNYRLMVNSEKGAELCMGVRHLHRRADPVPWNPDLGIEDVFLLSPGGELAVNLSPLAQMMSPSPGVPPELFLFSGAGRLGAILVAEPAGFERQDANVWTVLAAHGLDPGIGAAEKASASRPPYRGLASFTADDSDNFFGREFKAQTFANRLRVQAFLALVGPSGAGKSSFLQAGVLPFLPAGWKGVTSRPGPKPFATLEAKLLEAGVPAQGLAEATAKNPKHLANILSTHAKQKGPLLLMLDQFEELVTLCQDQDERARFAEALVLAASDPAEPVRVVLAMRDDFLVRVERVPALSGILSSRLELLDTPGPEDLRRILVEPAKRKGVTFEDEALVDEMLATIVDQPGALALLSFTASRLWELRDQHFQKLTRKAYQALGGVGGALAMHAEATLAEMTPEQLKLVRQMFRHLVTAEGTRAVLSSAELEQLLGANATTQQVLEKLVTARLVVTSEDAQGADRIEVIHEALLSSWPRLVTWQREDAEGARMRDQIRSAARQWTERKRPRGLLWRADVLSEYRVWRLRHPERLTDAEEAFAAASVRDEVRAQWLRRGAVIGVVLLLAGVWGGIRLRAQRELDRSIDATLSQGRKEEAKARELRENSQALAQQAFAAFDGQKKPEGEKLWAQSTAIIPQVQRHFLNAGNAFELALSLDPKRPSSRSAILDLLFDRALLASQLRQADAREELLERLAIYDLDGSARARWNAPGKLTLDVGPVPASLLIERYEQEGKTRTRVSQQDSVTHATLTLEPGSYLLTLVAADRVTLRYPVVMERAKEVNAKLELPNLKEVPEGYVLVPPGTFEFGYPGPDSVRSQYDTVPQHPRTTDAFLIKRDEITFGEWIEYLKALPPKVRDQRMAQHKAERGQGQAVLDLLPDGHFQLTVKIEASRYQVRDDEKLHYRARKSHEVQDWLRLPVMSVTFVEAKQYTDWLSESGKLKGARLCLETEWERGARGADDRTFSNGNKILPTEANYDETYNKNVESFGPDEVGSFPASRSPFELDDMVGNAQEWTQGIEGDGDAVVRSGAYFFAASIAASYNRTVVDKNFSDNIMGFRPCAAWGAK